MSNIGIIISREFNERVAKKSFIISTLLVPVFMLLMMVAPALIMTFSTPEQQTIAVIDKSHIVMDALSAEDHSAMKLIASDAPLDSLLADEQYDGVLVIAHDIVENPSKVTLYLHSSSSVELEGTINNAIKDVVETQRLKNYNIDNLNEILDEIHADVRLRTIRVDENGANESENVSSMISFAVGMGMMFILYMFLLLYGQMVMTSIIEEKNNRVLELMVSSVKPLHLMLGKIIGVGLVAVVQVVIWGVLICAMSMFLLPAIMPDALAQQVAAINAGSFDATATGFDPDMLQAIAALSSVGYIAKMFAFMLLFLIGGFLFYASIFAAIGSAVDNIQDASQLQTFAIIPIILALVFAMTVAADPNSTLALWLSVIPFTSPMVMLARIPFDIATWQIVLSVVVLYISFVAMAWVAAKIYRIGIFMYGKKPTITDLVRWMRYK